MSISATQDDLERWQSIGFDDILKYLHPETKELWVDAGTGKKLKMCPYIREACRLSDQRIVFFCGIQDMKPEKCAAYHCLRVELGCNIKEISSEFSEDH